MNRTRAPRAEGAQQPARQLLRHPVPLRPASPAPPPPLPASHYSRPRQSPLRSPSASSFRPTPRAALQRMRGTPLSATPNTSCSLYLSLYRFLIRPPSLQPTRPASVCRRHFPGRLGRYDPEFKVSVRGTRWSDGRGGGECGSGVAGIATKSMKDRAVPAVGSSASPSEIVSLIISRLDLQ